MLEQRNSMSETTPGSNVQLWFERKFDFTFPVEQFPNLCVRLRGVPPRLEDMVRSVARGVLTRKPGDKWSAQEHAGHLADLESLWMARVDDFLKDGGETLTVADLTNRRTTEAGHNDRKLTDILADFRAARLWLAERAVKFPAATYSRSLLHPRLKQPMRLVDHLYFVAEHDDHHLARIWELINE
jgi:DinB superfamily